ncbi:MAG: hypothetical protein IIB61_08405 [Planctomycetes bacterium]|nr:hypothetical protein [Planctomycetota bacterium]
MLLLRRSRSDFDLRAIGRDNVLIDETPYDRMTYVRWARLEGAIPEGHIQRLSNCSSRPIG